MSTSLARSITAQLRGTWCGTSGQVPGPGHSKRDRSTSIRGHPSDPDDVLVYSHAGHDFREIKDEWRARGLLPAKDRAIRPPDPVAKAVAAARKAEAEKEAAIEAASRLKTAIKLWTEQSEPADGTPVESYLNSRGIHITPLPTTIGYVEPNPPKYPYPTMIAAFGLAREPEPGRLVLPFRNMRGVHLTALAADGSGKAPIEKPRKMIGHSTGWPLVVGAPNDSLALVIGEGIESALSGHLATGAGAWAAGTKGRLPALADKVPSYIETITILAEADGRSEAHELASRLVARGCGFEVCLAEASHGRP